MHPLQVKSEIGPLKKVMVHRPGKEIANLTPKWLSNLLFDDIPWLPLAIEEHDIFAATYRAHGVEVVYLADLVAETLDSAPEIKFQFIKQFIQEAHVTSETLSGVLFEYLMSFSSTKAMVEKTMAGIKKDEVPNFQKRTLSDYIRDYPFVTDPMPNLYFTRDPFSIIGNGVVISKMYTTTRSRESIYGDYIFKFHPFYGKQNIPFYYERSFPSTIEGGDILVLNQHLLAIGVSERTHPAGIEKLAKNLFFYHETSFSTVLAFDIPKSRSFMHLDTIFTQVDYDKFTIHEELQPAIKVYEVTKDLIRPQKLTIKPIDKPIDQILSLYLDLPITLIPCGGTDVIASAREQWSDGANTVAIKPGEVIAYERNHITNDILDRYGIKVYEIPSSELSRGRGGPRCMSMPFYRENLTK
ncbi:MAG: arginine deiminase [Bacilli bacterium]|jgi:arginine deiminase|nr:arginine deiminase [Bacilli bacterium]HHU23897.1 arginine deiminase [Acholeplasmataceae bacterium]